MKRFAIFACLSVGIILGGCEPSRTNRLALGECSSLVLPADAGRNPDGYLKIYGGSALVSGKVKSTSADPQEFGVAGPAVARLIVSIGSGTTSVDLAVPAGKQIVVTDELSKVRCAVTNLAL
ncbi:MAG: hypothetical protein EON87_13630 [Brevundimonas sp.]|nr:MAG: hypothetical protein EON87_13630 [Brevundimonas sp.]